MENLRRYGEGPFSIAVLHGGPGAAGEMAPVARELSSFGGVLEPLQTAITLEGQVQELRNVLEENASLPVTLIGFSWGAMLGFILAARYPSLVRKLVLVSSGPYEEKYAVDITETRLSRLGKEERAEVLSLITALDNPRTQDKNGIFARLGELLTRADSYDSLPHQSEVEYRYDIFRGVWAEARELRVSGRLLELGRAIKCPVTAVHGEDDPHPSEGVREPLSRVLKDFRFILLAKCGHYAWVEREAKDRFYEILRDEIRC